jgi:microcystin-dependent protein
MVRLTRKNIKVFAGSSNNNGIFGSLQANNPVLTNDVEQIQSLAAWEDGWESATETSEELPPIEEMNSISYVTTYQQAYLMQEGMPEWSTNVTFYKGSLTKQVTSTGFRIYCSLTDNNLGNALSDTSNWKKVMDSDDLYAFDSAVVKLTGNQTIAGTKTFSVSPIAPTPTSGDSSTKVATTSFATTAINALSNTCVKLSGNQTISGTKTFNSSPIAPTPASTDNTQKVATTAFVKNNIQFSMPTGAILPFAGTSAPTGFLMCDGTAVSRSTYATLFAVIGTAYGTGNGSTTFNLPDYRDRTLFMRSDKAVGKTSLGSIPDHRHQSWGTSGSTGWSGSGANNGLYNTTYASEDTSLFSTSLYSKTVNKVIPSHASCNFIIKY